MKKFAILSVLMVCCLFAVMLQAQTATAPLLGNGTAENPYQISSLGNLYWITQDNARLALHYELTSHIDATETAGWFSGAGWIPIGTSVNRFTGSFNGNGYTISKLTLNRPGTSYQGLFGRVEGAKVRDLLLADVSVTGGTYTGGLAGWADSNSSLVGITINGAVFGSSSTGGLAGEVYGSTLEGIAVGGTVTGSNYTGGLAGYISGGNLGQSSTDVTLQGALYTGGLVGYTATSVQISQCFSLGAVTSTEYTGGLVGYHGSGTITDCYARGAVNGSSQVGGLIGLKSTGANIYRTYSSGAVSGSGSNIGGLIGSSSGGTVSHNYWDTQSSGQANSAGGAGVVGKTIAEMQQKATYYQYNFYTLWQINEGAGYPVFQDFTQYAQPAAVVLADLDGEGSEGNPYIITTADELNAMRLGLDKHYKLGNDIDLSASLVWNTGMGWSPVGASTSGQRFTGGLDGNGYTISNLAVNRPGTSYQGLFGYLQGAQVRDLRLADVSVTGGASTGGLAGRAESNSNIVGITINGAVFGSSYTGGLAGEAYSSTLEGIAVGGTVTGGNYTGGLAGYISGGNLGQSSTDVTLQSALYTGGLVGYTATSVQISQCFSLGAVTSTEHTGGLVGYHGSGTITDCYARGAVNGSSQVGGLIGLKSTGANIYRTYSSGAVSGSGSNIGGLIGSSSGGTVSHNYWDTQSSGQLSSAGGAGVAGKTTAQMQQKATYYQYNFYTLWQINEGAGYPHFQNLAQYAQPADVVLADLDGEGTAENPYIITTADELNAMRLGLDKHFKLGNDIDLSASLVWNTGMGWSPVGTFTSGQRFTGGLDGNSHAISNLAVNRPGTSYQGLFGYLQGVKVRDLRLADVSVTGGASTGGLAGRADSNSNIVGITINGAVFGSSYTGGLAGEVYGSNLEGIAVGGTVSGGNYTGGLAGYISGGNLGQSSTNATLQGALYTGGLVGYTATSAQISQCFSLGAVTSTEHTGGLVGYHGSGTITDCYARGAVNGSSQVGGLIGLKSTGANIYRTYSSGAVSGSGSNIGGLIGSSSGGTVSHNYWDTQSSGQLSSAGGAGVAGKTTAQMQQKATYYQYNFYTLWQINEGAGYPHFQNLAQYAQPADVVLDNLDGDGTEGNPYIITTADELNAMRLGLDKHFKLGNDIDLSASLVWNTGMGWSPLGTSTSQRFTGGLDGNSHTIFNLAVNRPGTSYQGLFGYLQGAKVRDLRLADVSVTGGASTGGLAGRAESISNIVGITINGAVFGSSYTGGLAGEVYGSTLEGIAVGGTVTGGNYTGGLAGYISGGNLGQSSTDVTVQGALYTGGLLGYTATSAQISQCFSLGSVAGTEQTGGLLGFHTSGTMTDCYARGAVNGSSQVGGLIGLKSTGANIYRTYSSGAVSGSGSNIGGLIGSSSGGTVSHNYWDTQSSGQANSAGGAGVVGKTTAEMKQQNTFTDWDFYTIWDIVNGLSYPFHRTTPVTYDIVATVVTTSGSYVTGAGQYNHGSPVSLQANAEAGFYFFKWTENGQFVSDQALLEFPAVEDRNLKAHFAPDEVVVDLLLQNENYQNTQECKDAAQTITLAGDGTTFIVDTGADITVIAGENIVMLPGTEVKAGGRLHAWITQADQYCFAQKAGEILADVITSNQDGLTETIKAEQLFRVYPNPTRGQFTLDPGGEPPGALSTAHEAGPGSTDILQRETTTRHNIRSDAQHDMLVEIFNIQGKRVISARLHAGMPHELSLSDQQPGLYMIRVVQGDIPSVLRIMKID